MQYRISKRDGGLGRGWGGTRTVPLETGCGLGYTYPNPVVSGKRLYLFMRGPCWYPYFTSTATASTGAPAHARARAQQQLGQRNVRPYAKYDAAPDGSILMTFSDGHPGSYKNNLYYMRFKDGRFYKADGSVIGTTRDLPFRVSDLDVVQPYSAGKGRPWPMDIAWNAEGVPSIVYSSRVGDDDVFRYARWNGSRWETRLISPAGGSPVRLPQRRHHVQPRRPALGRADAADRRAAGDRGPLHRRPGTHVGAVPAHARLRGAQLPPGVPARDLRPGRLVVVYVSGSASSFRSYRTVVNMRIDDGFFKPPAQRSQIQAEVLGRQAELLGQLRHPPVELHERLPEPLDLLVGQRAAVDPPQRLALISWRSSSTIVSTS